VTGDPARWGPDWQVEPCDTAPTHPYAGIDDDGRHTITVGSIDNYEPQEQP
jgi:hypothetical protein